jgi:hypothetical protein
VSEGQEQQSAFGECKDVMKLPYLALILMLTASSRISKSRRQLRYCEKKSKKLQTLVSKSSFSRSQSAAWRADALLWASVRDCDVNEEIATTANNLQGQSLLSVSGASVSLLKLSLQPTAFHPKRRNAFLDIR